MFFQTKLIAQEAKLDFDDELCRYTGYYDSTKYSSDQLRDTYKLAQGYFSIYSDEEEQLEDNYKNIKEDKNNYLVYTKYSKRRDVYFINVPRSEERRVGKEC